MINLSRRRLAGYAAEQLLQKRPSRQLAKELAAALVVSRRAGQTELLADDIAWELESRGQIANVQVTAARRLSDQLRRQVAAYVKQVAKVKQVVINEQIDESVIGGLRIETAAHGWDTTIKRQLTDIKESF